LDIWYRGVDLYLEEEVSAYSGKIHPTFQICCIHESQHLSTSNVDHYYLEEWITLRITGPGAEYSRSHKPFVRRTGVIC
jgi:hypothetical protein